MSSYDGQSSEKSEGKCTGLCRVILPDGSTTVVPTNQTESIKDVIMRLLEKRALRYSMYDVLVLTTNEVSATAINHQGQTKLWPMTRVHAAEKLDFHLLSGLGRPEKCTFDAVSADSPFVFSFHD